MPTTTIRIEDELKARVAAAAVHAGKTAHAFILDAITQTLAQAELDNDFQALADRRWASIASGGKTLSWDDTQVYLAARARGNSVKKPNPRKSRPAAAS